MKKLITLILFLFTSQVSYSQVTGGSAITAGTLSWKLGLGGGLLYGFSSGTLDCNCGYEFENLEGPGFYANVVSSMPLDHESDLTFGIGYQSLTISGTNEVEREKSVVGEPNPVLVNMESQADIDISSLYLTVGYKQKLPDGFFVSVGLDLHIVTNCQLVQNETIKDDRFEFVGGETTGIIYPKGDLKDYNNVQFNLKLRIGYDFVVNYKYLITPNVGFSYPFLKLTSSSSSTANVMSLTFGVNISYIF
jgi:hypothetical protein